MENVRPDNDRTPVVVFGRAVGAISMAALVLMMLLTVADVFLRYTFNSPILGSAEITELLMVPMAFAAIIWCTASKKHLHVDLLDRISPAVKNVSDLVFYILYCGLFSLIAWRSFLEALKIMPTAQSHGETTRLLSIPEYPFYLLIALSSGIIALIVLIFIVASISSFRGKRGQT